MLMKLVIPVEFLAL